MKMRLLPFAFCLLPLSAFAVGFPSHPDMPLSQYGMIQNVQNYSTNPYWDSNSPYNQRFPMPVYAQGTDLTAADCQAVVAQLVMSHCGARNNCDGVRLTDARPPLMVQLSKMPGNNYVSACGGFIDEAFNSYVAQYGNAVRNTNFPTAINPGNNVQGAEFKIENPYAPKLPSWSGDEWLKGIYERAGELEQLQSQNGGGNEKLAKAAMPKTYADLSFTERIENTRQGYEAAAAQGLVNSSYKTIQIESDLKRYQREADEAEAKKRLREAQQAFNEKKSRTV
ncbi:MAG: hypothetical protein LBJ73_02500 [Rickettsiales bacterium]|jgi:hypothetical protein|nr:hypothetical protein [Rickettsiales bacterium]